MFGGFVSPLFLLPFTSFFSFSFSHHFDERIFSLRFVFLFISHFCACVFEITGVQKPTGTRDWLGQFDLTLCLRIGVDLLAFTPLPPLPLASFHCVCVALPLPGSLQILCFSNTPALHFLSFPFFLSFFQAFILPYYLGLTTFYLGSGSALPTCHHYHYTYCHTRYSH